MGFLNPLKKSFSKEESVAVNLVDLSDKLKEIDEAVASLEQQRAKIDVIIQSRIDSVLADKLAAHKVDQTLEEYKRTNEVFVRELIDDVRTRYQNFLDEDVRILQSARKRLTMLKEFQNAN